MEPTTVLLTTEGTYPCYPGGVSIWCDRLIRSLPEIRFRVFAITRVPGESLRFALPGNVVGLQQFPLWGTEEPGWEEADFALAFRRKLFTTESVVRRKFIPPFEQVLSAIFADPPAVEDLAHGLKALHLYALRHDYARAVASRQAWEAFLRACAQWSTPEGELNLEEAAMCMRWLARYLGIVAVRWPAADITHASLAGLAGVPGVLLKLLKGCPYLLSEHGIYMRELYMQLASSHYPRRAKRLLIKFAEALVRMNYHYADRVTTLCDFNYRWQVRLGVDPAKLQVVPNGVDPSVFYPRPRMASDHLTVLTVARIFPLKGLHVLLEAASRVREKQPRVRFRILGSIGDRNYYAGCLDIIKQKGLGQIIEFGRTDRIAPAYAEADVFCLPSISEAAPFSLLEAMLSGCPIVATAVGGVPEILGNAGLLVRPNDPEDLAAALLFLLEDGPAGEQRRAMFSSLAAARGRARFTLDQMIGPIKEAYHGLLGKPGEFARAELAGQLGLAAAAGRA